MNVLVLGGKGMAGHMVVDYLNRNTDYDVYYTHRDSSEDDGIFLDVSDLNHVEEVLESLRPDVVINCVGLLNENAEQHPVDAILINSLLPHHVSRCLSKNGGKLVHISTDCVFSGKEGSYPETAEPDGTTVYARTKSLGEVVENPHVTIRTSIIGPELKDGIGLFHWFMKQSGTVNGFEKVYWNGVTTLELAKVIHKVIENDVKGLYHLTAPDHISKYDLLRKIKSVFEKDDVIIQPVQLPVCDRTLKNTRTDVGLDVPTYDVMLTQLRESIQHGRA